MDSQTTAADDHASFWLRAGAYMIDGFIASVAGVVVLLLLATLGLLGPARFAPLVITAAYFTVLPAVMAGQTPGKKLAGLEIVRRDGEPVTYVTGFVRWLGYMLSLVTLCLGFLMALFTAEGRALEDYVAGTRVIKRQDVSKARKTVVVSAAVVLTLACMLGMLASMTAPGLEQQQAQQAAADAAAAQGVSSPSSLPDRSNAR